GLVEVDEKAYPVVKRCEGAGKVGGKVILKLGKRDKRFG
nr:hypothetical protein [Tanacetum cinerariifolium]